MSAESATAEPDVGRSVDAGGIVTNYHDVGRRDAGGGAPLLLLHGSGPGVTAWANWRGVVPALSERHRVLAPDVVGFGYTERPRGVVYDRASWLRHVVDFLDALDVPRVSVVGNSFGGALALALASEAPERVEKLVLMGSVGVSSTITPGLETVWGFEPTPEKMREVLELFAVDHSRIEDSLVGLRLRAATRPGAQEAWRAMFPPPRQARLDALDTPDDALRALPHTTLVVHGRDDAVIPLSNAHRLLELIPRSQLHVFGQCGHWVQIEQREAFLDVLGVFLG